MTNSIKLEFNVPEAAPVPKTRTVSANSKAFKDAVETIVKDAVNRSHHVTNSASTQSVNALVNGPINPLYDLQPPARVQEVQNIVLLQAQDIKNVLENISFKDPTARCHFFPYVICPENEKLLHDNGFTTRVIYDNNTKESFTEVCWSDATKWRMTLPVPIDHAVVTI